MGGYLKRGEQSTVNVFFILFFIGIALYFLASVASIFVSSDKYSDKIPLIISLAASVSMAGAAVVEYFIYDFAIAEMDLFGELFSPVKLSIKADTISTLTLLVASIVSIIISVYIYTATQKRDIKVAYFKSGFLANLFMIVLSFMTVSNQSYFLTFLIGCAIVLIFTMLSSDFENREAASKANRYLILGNIAAIVITIGYSFVLQGSGMLTVNGFEAALVPLGMRNVTFMMIMGGIFILLSVIPVTNHNHIRLLMNGLFSKIILLITFRYVISLYSGNVSLYCILICLAAGIISVGYQSVRAAATIDGYKWLRHVDLALNAICFISIIFSMYADNLGGSLIADQIRGSAVVTIIASMVLYPAITIIIHCLGKVDKSKRFKVITLPIFIAKSLLPPIGGFAGIFIIISNTSALLDFGYFEKTLMLLVSLFVFSYTYIYYIYAHMKFFINVIDSGYEPEDAKARRKISKVNLIIIVFSALLTFMTGIIPAAVGYGISITYDLKSILMIISNVILMLIMVYFLNYTQVNTSMKIFGIKELKKAVAEKGGYHMMLKALSFIFLIIASIFFSISHVLIVDALTSYSILAVMYMLLSIFLLYDKDIDFQDLYAELFMMLAVIVKAVIPQSLIIDILMAIVCVFVIAFSLYRQKVKIYDKYDRFLVNGKIYLYIAFFLTNYADFTFNVNGVWKYVLHIIIGIIMFVVVYIVSSLISTHVFKRKKKVRKNI